MKAFLGTGLLGAGFVRAMLKKGEEVQVWNRTFSKAKDLEQYGAKAFENIEDAVKNADVIHLSENNDQVVVDALAQAENGLKPGAVLVEQTTATIEGTIISTKEREEKGFPYIHATV